MHGTNMIIAAAVMGENGDTSRVENSCLLMIWLGLVPSVQTSSSTADQSVHTLGGVEKSLGCCAPRNPETRLSL
ncbi:transposase [Roseinatronobacter sp.]|uniref:transposase n=1 Tax=Roseinatronobacter sp. TaxID=1945755 RepID=UPI0025D88352|nr:transposase [Rhodobaca sp.]